ncbi:MAG: carbamoyltransferase, partial [Bdellovibrionales bacterium CG12_big_fil_rev_8_21_14_0_65_38_15]
KQPRREPFESAYLGPEYSNDEIEQELKNRNLTYSKEESITKKVAKLIADQKIVGWFQGRMEAGPRALGNRSILADARSTDMKDRLNLRVKNREFFRPFAPSVLKEHAHQYFDLPENIDSPYMILSAMVKEDKRTTIPAVTHHDLTARPHTVSKKVNPKYWDLINEFYELTGVPVVINTSFNENEPIVCNPGEAIECFLRTEMDCIAIGDFLVSK